MSVTSLATSSKSDPIDLTSVEFYSLKENYEIQTCFDKYKYKRGDRFDCRVTTVYDPSKFYVVPKYVELEAFQVYIFKLYYTKGQNYKIPQEKFCVDMYCVVFSDTAYFRGLIVGFPTLQVSGQHALVFFLDYGSIGPVKLEDIYYMAEDLFAVPQFVVRASLSAISPIAGRLWSSEDGNRFSELISNRVLEAVVLYSDQRLQLVGINLCECDENGPVASMVHETLIAEERAKYAWEPVPEKFNNKPYCVYESKSKVGYMLPSHHVLETGKVPLTRSEAEYFQNVAPMLIYEGPYFKAKGAPAQRPSL